MVPLSRVATVEMDEGYTFVRREQLSRYAVLQMDVRGATWTVSSRKRTRKSGVS